MDSLTTPSVLLTHPHVSDSDVLTTNLQAAGVACTCLPLLSLVASDDSVVDKHVAAIAPRDVLVFTSKNGVKYFLESCRKLQLSFVANEVYALGAKTADAARDCGLSVAFVGSGESSTVFAEEIIKRDTEPSSAKRYVLLRGERASNELPQLLISNGFNIVKITVYQALKVELDAAERSKLKSWLLSAVPAKLVVFTSSLAAEIFCNHLQQLSMISTLPAIDVAVLGSTTRNYVADLGFRNIFMPEQATIEDLSELVNGLVKKG